MLKKRRENVWLQPSGRTAAYLGPEKTSAKFSSCPSSFVSHWLQRERKTQPTNHMKSAGFEAYWVKCIILLCKVVWYPLHCIKLLPLCLLLEDHTSENSMTGKGEDLQPYALLPGLQVQSHPQPLLHHVCWGTDGQRDRGRAQPMACWMMLELSWVLDCELERLGWRCTWFWLCKRNSN